MRKIAIILSALLCFLFFETGDSAASACDEAVLSTTIGSDRGNDDAWRCAQTYNADLNLPRISGEVSAAPVARVFQRTTTQAGQHVDRYVTWRSDAQILQATSKFKSSDLSAGLVAVDYYVFRLRRLII